MDSFGNQAMSGISSIILAGGRATRMSGVDKGLIQLQNQPFIQHVINRIQPQVDEIFINANREIVQYEAFGYDVLQDENQDFAGPLAGILLGLKHAKHELVLSVPCDSPLLPLDLVARLYSGMAESLMDIDDIDLRGRPCGTGVVHPHKGRDVRHGEHPRLCE